MASGIAEHVPAAGVFVKASSSPEWYEHLHPRGSCFSLLSLLVKQRELIHELGPKGITVLHKGVQHGCVVLVKFVLVNMFDDEGYCTCRKHGPGVSQLTREQLLRKACEDDITAVQMAVVSGSPKMVLLLKWAIEKNKLEVKQKNASSSKGDEATSSDAARVRIRRVQHRSTRNALLFAGEWGMEGEDMRRLFEVGNKEDCDPSTPPEVCPSDAEEEVVEETLPDFVIYSDCNNVVVPDVKDDTIDCVYEDGSEEGFMIPRVYDLIQRVLEDPVCFQADIQEDIKIWTNKCMTDVDFEFVPVAHVFLHFLFGSLSFTNAGRMIFEIIIRACNEHDLKEQGNPQGSGSMVATLFKILDPRGRTFLHAALSNVDALSMIQYQIFRVMEELDLKEISIELVKECMNSKDGAGRTILHLMCTYEQSTDWMEWFSQFKKWNLENNLDWDAKLFPLCHEELDTLKKWCFPQYRNGCSYKPIHLAILFNSITIFKPIYLHSKVQEDNILDASHAFDFSAEGKTNYLDMYCYEPIQLAGFLGRPTILEEILKSPGIKRINDVGILGPFLHLPQYPALHCAILSGQVDAIQSILKFPIYDPFIQHRHFYYGTKSQGTALHYLLKRKNFKTYVTMFQTIALFHVLPNSKSYARLKDEFSKLYSSSERKGKMFSAIEMSCINLLLQAGIDIWTPHCETGELPSPGPRHNDAAREWWYNKVVNEVVTQKTSINIASNATSVIATLVATASFIGPLQPPLGLADDGFLYTSARAVRVYFVCNGLSFYFSIASILMAVLPAIPMPKESLYDELFRSQRCLKSAALLLLVAIICLLSSFTCASFAVVSLEEHDIQLVGTYVGVGGAVCVMVLVVYMIRMLRMVFHKNDRFRRWFAKNMRF